MFILGALHGIGASLLAEGSLLKLRAGNLGAVWSRRQPLANAGAVLSLLDGPQGSCVLCGRFRFRMMRRYLAYRSSEVGLVHRMLEIVRDGCPGQGPVHLLVASAAGIGFEWDPHMSGWARPGLPGLSNVAGPMQHLRSAILDAWLIFALARVFVVASLLDPCSSLIRLMLGKEIRPAACVRCRGRQDADCRLNGKWKAQRFQHPCRSVMVSLTQRYRQLRASLRFPPRFFVRVPRIALCFFLCVHDSGFGCRYERCSVDRSVLEHETITGCRTCGRRRSVGWPTSCRKRRHLQQEKWMHHWSLATDTKCNITFFPSVLRCDDGRSETPVVVGNVVHTNQGCIGIHSSRRMWSSKSECTSCPEFFFSKTLPVRTHPSSRCRSQVLEVWGLDSWA